MTKAMVDYFASRDYGREHRINIIPGYVEPSDMQEIKRIAWELGVEITLFPDTSNVLNGPQTGKFEMFPKGGVTVDALLRTGAALGTIGLGGMTSGPAARALDSKCKVHCEVLDLPIGIKATDAFIDTLRKMAGVPVPDSLSI
jgi:nitrogenase molybdenum-iron protein beta chain